MEGATALSLGIAPAPRALFYRYTSATPLMPHLKRLAGTRSMVVLPSLMPFRAAAAMSETARAALRNDVLAQLYATRPDRAAELLELLGHLVAANFNSARAARACRRNEKTVTKYRLELEQMLELDLRDHAHQVTASLAYGAHILDEGAQEGRVFPVR